MGVDVTHNLVKSDQQGMSARFQATLLANLHPSPEPMPRRFPSSAVAIIASACLEESMFFFKSGSVGCFAEVLDSDFSMRF